MKTVYSDNEDGPGLIEQQQNLLKCNVDLAQTYNILKSTPRCHKGHFYKRVLARNETRSMSLPNDLDENKTLIADSNDNNCDMKATDRDSPPLSPSHELWFKTWPERCEKVTTPDAASESKNVGKLTLNEALKSISLAYSPVTKQLHLVQSSDKCEESLVECKPDKLGHKRNNPGSFSSTISSLSDVSSPSGSLLDSEDQTSLYGSETGAKSKKKGFSNFFNRNVFSWKTTPHMSGPSSVWKLFSKASSDTQTSPQHHVISSAALIQHMRPSNLPAKTLEEEQRHRDEYKAMLAAAKKKEAITSAAKQKQQKCQLQLEEQQAYAAKHFAQTVLPNWEAMCKTKKTKELWWLGLPSSVRGKVWRLAIGNDLNLTQQLYEICLSRAQNRLNSPEPPSDTSSDIDQESSLDVIQLDISRTFPSLCIFQEGGPYSDVLHSLLAAYVCYRPDVGYVQGMSYIAAILILNMEPYEAFMCFANLLNRPLHVAAFTHNQAQMQAYFSAFSEMFQYNLPKLYAHFESAGLTPELYLLEWIYTVYAKAMPLDVACRIWDLFLRDGDEFIFRTGLGILHLNQDHLITMDFIHGAQFLIRLPDDLSADQLFKSIQTVTTSIGKQSFHHIVDRCSLNPPDI